MMGLGKCISFVSRMAAFWVCIMYASFVECMSMVMWGHHPKHSWIWHLTPPTTSTRQLPNLSLPIVVSGCNTNLSFEFVVNITSSPPKKHRLPGSSQWGLLGGYISELHLGPIKGSLWKPSWKILGGTTLDILFWKNHKNTEILSVKQIASKIFSELKPEQLVASLKLPVHAPENRQRAPKGNESSSNHPFSDYMLVSGSQSSSFQSDGKNITFSKCWFLICIWKGPVEIKTMIIWHQNQAIPQNGSSYLTSLCDEVVICHKIMYLAEPNLVHYLKQTNQHITFWMVYMA